MLKSLALAGVCLLTLSACTSLGRAAIPVLPEAEIRIKPKMLCSDLAAKIAASGPLAVPQLMALYTGCEQMQTGTTISPEALRGAMKVPLVP